MGSTILDLKQATSTPVCLLLRMIFPFIRAFLLLHLPLILTAWRFNLPKLRHSRIPTLKLFPRANPSLRRIIVSAHNYFRSNVKPPAADMLRMTWDTEAAAMAQEWAGQCKGLQHNSNVGRHTKRFGSCGENIFIATHKVPWHFAIKSWYSEKDFFKYGCKNNNLTEVGHYTQMVWNASHKVGCGFAKCVGSKSTGWKKYYSYICNYCPQGNFISRLQKPYKIGKPCSKCKGSCTKKRSKRKAVAPLCTNSCPVADHWMNCKELRHDMGSWMCDSKYYFKHCRATCNCKGAVLN